jgi:hypothetical protein
MGILTTGRGSILPSGAEWIDKGWWTRPPTDAVIFEEVSRTFAGQTLLGYRRIEAGDIPADRTYRNALADNGTGALVFDMPKARGLHMDKLRRARVAQLEALDVELIRAIGRGGSGAGIEERKQALRDMPQRLAPALEACKTVEALKLVGVE